MTKVVVIDYGMGNLHSVCKAMRSLGADVQLSPDPKVVANADRLVLPGVGAFADGMAGLRKRGLDEALRKPVAAGRPFLGICLGMQMLLGRSEEFGDHEGLGLIPGRVRAIVAERGLKIPHIGWNRLEPHKTPWAGTLLREVPVGTMFYFVHSFAAEPERLEDRLADTRYGTQKLCAAIGRGNLTGFQCHPEKSGPFGLRLLEEFLKG